MYVIPAREELRLATLCVDYLNLPGFCGKTVEPLLLGGYYAFMEYAISYWVRHLEAGIAERETSEEPSSKELTELTESLEFFLEKHWASPSSRLQVSARNVDRLVCFKEAPFYDTLEQVIVSTRKQIKFFGKMKKEEVALDLIEVL